MKRKAQKGVPEWSRESIPTRLHRCRAMLNIHGVLTTAENQRISQRILVRYVQPAQRGVEADD